MKLLLSKNLILAVVVVAALTAGTGLLASYVDGPKDAQVAVDSKCVDCPREGTPACCKIAGSCQHHEKEAATTVALESTCSGTGCGGCGEKKAETPSCSGAGCGGQTQGSCGSGGCCPSK